MAAVPAPVSFEFRPERTARLPSRTRRHTLCRGRTCPHLAVLNGGGEESARSEVVLGVLGARRRVTLPIPDGHGPSRIVLAAPDAPRSVENSRPLDRGGRLVDHVPQPLLERLVDTKAGPRRVGCVAVETVCHRGGTGRPGSAAHVGAGARIEEVRRRACSPSNQGSAERGSGAGSPCRGVGEPGAIHGMNRGPIRGVVV